MKEEEIVWYIHSPLFNFCFLLISPSFIVSMPLNITWEIAPLLQIKGYNNYLRHVLSIDGEK